MLETIPISESISEPIPESITEPIPELISKPIPVSAPKSIPGSESAAESESTWESQFATVTESGLTPEMELALKR